MPVSHCRRAQGTRAVAALTHATALTRGAAVAARAGATLTAAAAGVLAAVGLLIPAAGPARAAVGQPASGPVGPLRISPLGHRGLCWEAWGNGTAVTLETCRSGLQAQDWTFTGHNSVLLNGNGYCAQNGGLAPSTTNGPPPAGGDSVFLSFAGQCAGSPSQQWAFSAGTGQIGNTPAGVCAYVQGGALVPGAVIVARACGSAGRTAVWSLGTSALTLSAGPGARPPAATPPWNATHRAFSAQVTVSNPVTASTAYAASVWFARPSGLTVTRLTATGLPGWTCTAATLRCRGNLAGGGRGHVTIAGTVARLSARPALTAHALVSGTNESSRGRLTAVSTATALTALPTLASPGGRPPAVAAGGPPTGRFAMLGLIVAGLLVVLGVVLAVLTRRRRQPAADAAGGAGGAPAAGAPGSPETSGAPDVPVSPRAPATTQVLPATRPAAGQAAGRQADDTLVGLPSGVDTPPPRRTPASHRAPPSHRGPRPLVPRPRRQQRPPTHVR